MSNKSKTNTTQLSLHDSVLPRIDEMSAECNSIPIASFSGYQQMSKTSKTNSVLILTFNTVFPINRTIPTIPVRTNTSSPTSSDVESKRRERSSVIFRVGDGCFALSSGAGLCFRRAGDGDFAFRIRSDAVNLAGGRAEAV